METKTEEPMTNIVRAVGFKGGLFLGGIKAAQDAELLRKERITAVLTVAHDVYVEFGETSMRHRHIKAKDTKYEALWKHFDEAADFISEELGKGNVLVHCRMGVSRSASIVIAYLIKYFKLTYEQAFERVKNKRFEINPIAAFREQLAKYEERLRQE